MGRDEAKRHCVPGPDGASYFVPAASHIDSMPESQAVQPAPCSTRMKETNQFRRWQRRSIRLLADLARLSRSCQDEDGEERLHRLRVALRRVRLYLRLARPWLGPDTMDEFRRWSAALAETTGRVRDLDVGLAWLRGKAGASEVRELLRRRRSRLWNKSKVRLSPPPTALAAALEGLAESKERTRQFAKRLRKRTEEFKAEVARQSPGFPGSSPAARHELRRTLRRWRYLHELLLPCRKHARDRLLKLLIQAQEAIGEERNRHVTDGLLRRLRGSGGRTELMERLERERAEWACRANAALKTIGDGLRRNRAKPWND